MFRPILLLPCLALLLAVRGPAWAEESDTLKADENRLHDAFQSTDAQGLSAFLRLRARGEPETGKLNDLIAALGNADVNARQNACTQLVAIGAPAIPLLREAARDADNAERATLARKCLSLLDNEAGALTGCAARLLANHRFPGTADVLLEYLPHSESDAILEELKTALAGVAHVKGKADPSLLNALGDEHPLRRASAIVALCQGGMVEPRETLRKLLTDPMPSVRLRASLALAQAADARAVTALVDLLGELSGDSLSEVEAFLNDLAGETAPHLEPTIDAAARKAAWTKWWQDTEGTGLLDELRKRTVKEADRERSLALIEKLGDDDFEVRQQAEKDLLALGTSIAALLKQAQKHPDLEVKNRAAKCLAIIEKDRLTPLTSCTARLIALRKPAGAAEVILNFLPFAEDEAIVDELQTTLNVVAFPEGKVAPGLVKALDDKIGIRRAAAATALCRGGLADHLPGLRRALKDKDPLVRLKIALALADVRESEAIPVLAALVGELPAEYATVAEDYLYRIARDTAPKEMPTGDDGRAKRATLWATWWNENRDHVVLIDRLAIPSHERFHNYTLLIQPNNAQVVEQGPDGKQRWAISGLANPWDAQVVSGDHVLIAEFNGNRVTERDLRGAILWEHRTPTGPMSVERLRNGNTFIVCRDRLIEVDRAGREVIKIERPHDIMSGRKLPSGQIVCVTNNRQVLRLDRTGRAVKTFVTANVFFNTNEILDNGHVLIPLAWMNHVLELDGDGKEVARFTAMQPNHAVRLPNGNTLVASQNGAPKLYEFDRKGKQIAETTVGVYTFRVRRH
jgi:HEAT repeat protein